MVKELKKWSDFEVGKKYKTKSLTKSSFVTCVGFMTTGLPILENSSGQIYPASSYGYGRHIESWSEYTEPREFWILTYPGNAYNLAYSNEIEAEERRDWGGGCGEIVQVKEVP